MVRALDLRLEIWRSRDQCHPSALSSATSDKLFTLIAYVTKLYNLLPA